MHTPEQILALLREAIENRPAMDPSKPAGEPVMRWFAKTGAVIDMVDGGFSIRFRDAQNRVGVSSYSPRKAIQALYDAFYKAELSVPAEHSGTFIPPGDAWHGYAALLKPVQSECDHLLIVDPYISAGVFTELLPHAAAKQSICLLTTQRKELHAALFASNGKWATTHQPPSPPVEVRYAQASELHDRLIILDQRETWLLSQSIKDIAKKSAASISRADAELGKMKAQHYHALWAKSVAIA